MGAIFSIAEPGAPTRQVALEARPLVAGRSPDADVQLADPKASLRHLQLSLEAAAVVVTDLGSMNGTLVNGERVSREVLKAGDRITVGDTQVTLLSVDAQGLAPTTAVPLAGANPPAQPEPEPYRTAQPPAAQPAAAAPAGPKCPYCYEPIIPNAAKCKHCGTWLDPSRKPLSEPVPAPQPAPVQYHPPAPGWAQPVQPVPVANQGAPGAVMVAQYDKSFVGSAFLVWLLYYLGCYLIGLILNLTYLSEANRHGAMTGRAPSGTGCLWALLIVHLILPIVAVLILVLLMAVGGLSASDILD